VKEDIKRFLTYLSVEKGFSENTLAAYQNDLSQLASFVEKEAVKQGLIPSWAFFNRQGMLSYQLNLKERNYAATTVARKVAAAKSFFKFMVAENIIKDNPTENIASPNVGRLLPKPISISQVRRLLEQPAKQSTPEAKRDKAMLELLYASGMRVSELTSLNLSDVDIEGGFVRCFGKGHKERMVPIHRQAAAAVEEYIKEARPKIVRRDEEKALFLNRRGERLTRQGFWQILKGYAKAAGLDKEITPHTLRHSFANISTTQVYTHLTTEHVRRTYNKSHPRSK
jgi:integrase/recombinase XerD